MRVFNLALFEAGTAVLTDGRLDPMKINPIAAKYDISYEEPPLPSGPAATPATSAPRYA